MIILVGAMEMLRGALLSCIAGALLLASTPTPVVGQYAIQDTWDVGWEPPRVDVSANPVGTLGDGFSLQEVGDTTEGRRWGRSIGRGALFGAGAGAALYGVMWIMILTKDWDSSGGAPIFDPFVTGAGLVVTGAMVGAGIGFLGALAGG